MKETIAKETAREMANYLLQRAEYSQNRYIANELFITDLMEMNWIQRALSRGKIIRHLTEMINSRPEVKPTTPNGE